MENSEIQRRDKMKELPDDLLLKILSRLSSNDVAATSVLLKRWRSLWKEVKTFRYEYELDTVYMNLTRGSFYYFKQFISKRSTVEGSSASLRTSVKPLVENALNRELRIGDSLFELPEILYINNISSQLETLVLEKLSLADVPLPSNVSLASLKSLHVLSVKFSNDESVKTLLSICLRLEDLVVKQSSYNTNVMIFTINVPTLTSLSIYTSSQPKGVHDHGFLINTPSLRRFSIRDSFSNYLRFENMPNLVKASVNIVSDSVPECLEIFEWRQYNGTEQERKAAKYILANASRLNKATFYSESSEKHGMLKELECAARGSMTCQLVFG